MSQNNIHQVFFAFVSISIKDASKIPLGENCTVKYKMWDTIQNILAIKLIFVLCCFLKHIHVLSSSVSKIDGECSKCLFADYPDNWYTPLIGLLSITLI